MLRRRYVLAAAIVLFIPALWLAGCSSDESTPGATGGTSAGGGGSGGSGGSGAAAGSGGTAGSGGSGGGGGGSAPVPIGPDGDHPMYWSYQGAPALLLGSSSDDNLFQTSGSALTDELDALVAAGGNYLRNTMSSRDDHGHEVQPFHYDDGQGLFDLGQWNDEYWDRFSTFLDETASRDIIVEIEVWATWDFYQARWQANPWNPANNSSYDAAGTILEEDWPHNPYQLNNPFFETVPDLNDDAAVLDFQQAFVDKLLSHSLSHPNVLYTMDNETSTDPAWFRYWIDFIASRASDAGVTVQTSEMLDEWNITHAEYDELYGDPTRYTFIEVSQNNHLTDQTHYDRALGARQSVVDSGALRPLNNDKIYGADTDPWNYGDHEALERFWRSLFAGHAAVRFHRPTAGLGASPLSYAHIASARLLFEAFDLFASAPDNSLLGSREGNEAFCLAQPGEQYAVVFPASGQITLDVSAVSSGTTLTVRWLDLGASAWNDESTVSADGSPLDLQTPSDGFWAVVVRQP